MQSGGVNAPGALRLPHWAGVNGTKPRVITAQRGSEIAALEAAVDMAYPARRAALPEEAAIQWLSIAS